MEAENNNGHNWTWILIIALIWSLFFHKQKFEGMTAEEWFNEYDETEYQLRQTRDALDQANSNIEDAKYYTWESYDDMGEALDNLETVEP